MDNFTNILDITHHRRQLIDLLDTQHYEDSVLIYSINMLHKAIHDIESEPSDSIEQRGEELMNSLSSIDEYYASDKRHDDTYAYIFNSVTFSLLVFKVLRSFNIDTSYLKKEGMQIFFCRCDFLKRNLQTYYQVNETDCNLDSALNTFVNDKHAKRAFIFLFITGCDVDEQIGHMTALDISKTTDKSISITYYSTGYNFNRMSSQVPYLLYQVLEGCGQEYGINIKEIKRGKINKQFYSNCGSIIIGKICHLILGTQEETVSSDAARAAQRNLLSYHMNIALSELKDFVKALHDKTNIHIQDALRICKGDINAQESNIIESINSTIEDTYSAYPFIHFLKGCILHKLHRYEEAICNYNIALSNCIFFSDSAHILFAKMFSLYRLKTNEAFKEIITVSDEIDNRYDIENPEELLLLLTITVISMSSTETDNIHHIFTYLDRALTEPIYSYALQKYAKLRTALTIFRSTMLSNTENLTEDLYSTYTKDIFSDVHNMSDSIETLGLFYLNMGIILCRAANYHQSLGFFKAAKGFLQNRKLQEDALYNIAKSHAALGDKAGFESTILKINESKKHPVTYSFVLANFIKSSIPISYDFYSSYTLSKGSLFLLFHSCMKPIDLQLSQNYMSELIFKLTECMKNRDEGNEHEDTRHIFMIFKKIILSLLRQEIDAMCSTIQEYCPYLSDGFFNIISSYETKDQSAQIKTIKSKLIQELGRDSHDMQLLVNKEIGILFFYHGLYLILNERNRKVDAAIDMLKQAIDKDTSCYKFYLYLGMIHCIRALDVLLTSEDVLVTSDRINKKKKIYLLENIQCCLNSYTQAISIRQDFLMGYFLRSIMHSIAYIVHDNVGMEHELGLDRAIGDLSQVTSLKPTCNAVINLKNVYDSFHNESSDNTHSNKSDDIYCETFDAYYMKEYNDKYGKACVDLHSDIRTQILRYKYSSPMEISKLIMQGDVIQTDMGYTSIKNHITLFKHRRNLESKIPKPSLFHTKQKARAEHNLFYGKWKAQTKLNVDPALLRAAKKNNTQRMIEFCTNTDNHRSICDKDSNGNNILHLVTRLNNIEVVQALPKWLLAESSSMYNNDSETPLHIAAMYGYASLMKVLLENTKNVNPINDRQETPLLLAIIHDYEPVVKILLEKGADIKLFDKEGNTAIILAAKHGYINVLETLLTCEVVNLTDLDHDAHSALDLAIMNKDKKAVELLLKAYINAGIAWHDSSSTKRLAIQYADLEVVKILQKYTHNSMALASIIPISTLFKELDISQFPDIGEGTYPTIAP